MVFRLLVIFLFFSFSAFGQRDLIITQAGEQIRCKITGETSMRFSYSYTNEKGKTVHSEIFKTLVSSYKYNFFQDDKAATPKTLVQKPTKTYNSPLKEKQNSPTTSSIE